MWCRLHRVTHWSAFTVALAGQFSALQTTTMPQRKPNSPACPTSSPSFGGERPLLEAQSVNHDQTCWVMPLTPSSSVMSQYTIPHPLYTCPNQQRCHSTAVLLLHVAEVTCNCCTYKWTSVGPLSIVGMQVLVFLFLCVPECNSGAVSREMKRPSPTNCGTLHIISAVLYGESEDIEQVLMCNEGSLDFVLSR